MLNNNKPTRYSNEFKKTIVTLYQSDKTYADIKKNTVSLFLLFPIGFAHIFRFN